MCAQWIFHRKRSVYCWGGSDRFALVYRHHARIYITIYRADDDLFSVDDCCYWSWLKQFNALCRCNVFPPNTYRKWDGIVLRDINIYMQVIDAILLWKFAMDSGICFKSHFYPQSYSQICFFHPPPPSSGSVKSHNVHIPNGIRGAINIRSNFFMWQFHLRFPSIKND